MEDAVIKTTFAEEVAFAISKYKEHAKEIKMIRLKVNNSIRAYGKASYKLVPGYRKFRVAISRVMNHKNPERLVDTVKHELAHIVDALIRGKSNHDDHWKEVAETLGARPVSRVKMDNRTEIIAEHQRTRRQTFHAYECGCMVRCFKRAKKNETRHRDEETTLACKKCKQNLFYKGTAHVEKWKEYSDKQKKEMTI
mgnify:CR=1 FL=1